MTEHFNRWAVALTALGTGVLIDNLDLSRWVLIGLTALGTGAAGVLFVRRYRQVEITHSMIHRRVLFVDMILFIVMTVMLADVTADLFVPGGVVESALRIGVVAGRGGILAGMMALLITFPGDEPHDIG